MEKTWEQISQNQKSHLKTTFCTVTEGVPSKTMDVPSSEYDLKRMCTFPILESRGVSFEEIAGKRRKPSEHLSDEAFLLFLA